MKPAPIAIPRVGKLSKLIYILSAIAFSMSNNICLKAGLPSIDFPDFRHPHKCLKQPFLLYQQSVLSCLSDRSKLNPSTCISVLTRGYKTHFFPLQFITTPPTFRDFKWKTSYVMCCVNYTTQSNSFKISAPCFSTTLANVFIKTLNSCDCGLKRLFFWSRCFCHFIFSYKFDIFHL